MSSASAVSAAAPSADESLVPAAATRIEAVNDFVVKFANVNGSGSASANELFAKAILRMGVPVSPRNIFPSNIQGLPTWYEARVSEQGFLGRRGGIDMMVAMNPQTWAQDVAEIDSGGYLLHDSTRPLPPEAFRDDAGHRAQVFWNGFEHDDDEVHLVSSSLRRLESEELPELSHPPQELGT